MSDLDVEETRTFEDIISSIKSSKEKVIENIETIQQRNKDFWIKFHEIRDFLIISSVEERKLRIKELRMFFLYAQESTHIVGKLL